MTFSGARLAAACFSVLIFSLVPQAKANAAVRLAKIFSNHMVLQEDKPIVVWGWAGPNETVEVEFAGNHASATANERGEWKVELPRAKAGGPFVLKAGDVELNDIMVGEVWLCSGQSNMEMGIGNVNNAKEEIQNAKHPLIRLFMVPNRWSPQAQADLESGSWEICSPESIARGGWNGFSACAYFFGRELQQRLGVPIGLIDSDWGGTRIESWTPPEGFAAVPELHQESERVQLGDPRSSVHREKTEAFLNEMEQWMSSARQALEARTTPPPMPSYPADLAAPHDLQNATALYNGMIYPLRHFPIRGAIWYQGEANLDDGALYFHRMQALIRGWRAVWGEGDFPFYFVQIAPYNYGGRPERMGPFWVAQAEAQSIPETGMAVINDIGNLKDIHPKNKQEVGRRLALWALAKTYGSNDLVYCGPVFKSMKIEGNKLRLSFDHAGSGLASRDNQPLSWFEIIDAGHGGFVHANAVIDGSDIILSSPEAPHPAAVRFAWSMLAEPRLVNSAGLPCSAFHAGKIPKRDVLSMHVPEAKDYQLVYDLDLNKLDNGGFAYSQDHSAAITGAFDRIAYCLELRRSGQAGEPEFVFVSMDAFTDDLKKIGVPTAQSNAFFRQNVQRMDVFSNAAGVRTGTDLAAGNIEFWPNNYGPENSAKVPNASGEVYDFGDEPSAPVDGYGSMQIHNHDARQTILALNHWRAGNKADVGIGNQPRGNSDWTFAANAGSYELKRLLVFVRSK
ncbi:MAG TPA: sialate O-acetylesterase [Verrucomicrobiae bacterium]|nr:sialate O-acetylesterase [Verrucomicrobiae bacterium]